MDKRQVDYIQSVQNKKMKKTKIEEYEEEEEEEEEVCPCLTVIALQPLAALMYNS